MSDITVTVTDDTDISLTVSPGADLSSSTTDDLNEGTTNLYHTSERVDDRVNSLLVAGSNITLTYDDTANTLTVAAATTDDLSDNDTDDLAEGSTNLYYTDARVDTALTTVGGHILPAADDAQDLGSPTKQWRELYLGPTSLYVDGVQLISRTADIYDFTTDSGQDIRLAPAADLYLAPTSGNTRVSSGNVNVEGGDVTLTTGDVTATAGNVVAGGFVQTGGAGLKTDLITDAADIRIETGDTSFLHADTGNVYIGTDLAQAVHITGTEVKGVGTHPNITANNLTVGGTLSGIDTDDVGEGSSNLYYTDARADARIANNIIDEDSFATDSATRAPSQQSTKAYIAAQIQTKDQLSELSGSTDDVAEGSTNLYYTDTRARAVSIENVVEDTTPQLGGDLDLNSNNITGTGNIDTTGSLTLSGDITGDSGDLNVVNTVDGSDIVFKIDDTGGTTDTAMTLTFDDYQHNDTVGSGGTTETRYNSYILQEGHGIKIGADGEFSSTGSTPNNDAGDYQVNGIIINPTGNTWPTVNLTGTGQSKDGSNPLRDRLGDSVAGGFYSQFPNNTVLFNAADDTIASPGALSNGRRMGQFAFQGYDGNNYGGSGSSASVALTVSAIEDHATTNDRAGKMTFEFTAAGGDGSGGRTTVLTLDQTGADINGTLDVSGTTDLAGNLEVNGSQIDFTNLPTSDPSVAGRLWNDSGTVKISAG